MVERVTPHVGVRIETSHRHMLVELVRVTPHVGVRIDVEESQAIYVLPLIVHGMSIHAVCFSLKRTVLKKRKPFHKQCDSIANGTAFLDLKN